MGRHWEGLGGTGVGLGRAGGGTGEYWEGAGGHRGVLGRTGRGWGTHGGYW